MLLKLLTPPPLLRYFQGVLFLTSNRVEALDPAFQSRVQCALKYDSLSKSSRAQIWENLLKARNLKLDASVNIEALAAHELNGRQIKNALQLALALARRNKVDLDQSHLEATLKLALSFAEAVGESSSSVISTDEAAAMHTKIKKLLAAGLITQDEFDKKKAAIAEAL